MLEGLVVVFFVVCVGGDVDGVVEGLLFFVGKFVEYLVNGVEFGFEFVGVKEVGCKLGVDFGV